MISVKGFAIDIPIVRTSHFLIYQWISSYVKTQMERNAANTGDDPSIYGSWMFPSTTSYLVLWLADYV